MATRICKKSYILENGKPIGSTFEFGNGHTHKVMYSTLQGEEVAAFIFGNGVHQTLGDAYSGSDGNADTAEAMFLARLETLQGGSYYKGERGVGGQVLMDLAEALAELTGTDAEAAWATVKDKAEEAKGEGKAAEEAKAWINGRKKRADVKAIMTRLVAERAERNAVESTMSVDDLL